MEIVAFRSALHGGGAGRQGVLTLVELESSTGLHGWGAVRDPAGISDEVHQQLEAAVLGWDPALVQGIIAALGPMAQHPAARAVELALWDLLGRTAGEPLYRLWGGHKDRVRCLCELEPGGALDAMTTRAAGVVAAGVRGLALTIDAGDPLRHLERVRAVRETVGDEVWLAVHWRPPPGAGSTATAVALVTELDQLGVGWLECGPEVVEPRDLPELRAAAGAMLVVAGGQSDLAALGDATLHDGCDILRPGNDASPLTLWKAAALAEAANLGFVPPSASDGLSLIANLHLAAAVPSCEWIVWPAIAERHLEPLAELPQVDRDGYLRLSPEPGLGVDVDAFERQGLSGARW